jgi:hypothetical protein
MDGYLKPLLGVVAIAVGIFAVNLSTGGGLFAIFATDWRAPKAGPFGSQATCIDSCGCQPEEQCVDGTCRRWGCVVSSIGRGGCPEHSRCQPLDGTGVCVKTGTDMRCD